MATNVTVNPDTLIAVRVSIQGTTKKLKIPMKDLVPYIFWDKVRLTFFVFLEKLEWLC